MSDMTTKEYMEKKLMLLYVQTVINLVFTCVGLGFLVWLYMNTDLLKDIFG